MQYGIYVPNFGPFGDAELLAELAHEAEDAGWQGVFIWDHLAFLEPLAEAWVALTAMALRTSRIRLGPLVTPVPRRHIAKLAREVITLDRLSTGRLILGVGAGFPYLPDYRAFGDQGDARERAAKLDEALEVLDQLMSGAPVKHRSERYQIDTDGFQPSLQRPRVPIWVAASWPAQKPLARAARWDGVVPVVKTGLEVQPEDLARIVDAVRAQRGHRGHYDVTRFGRTEGPRDTAMVERCAEAGATWWIEYVYASAGALEAVRARLHQGPPRI